MITRFLSWLRLATHAHNFGHNYIRDRRTRRKCVVCGREETLTVTQNGDNFSSSWT